MESIEKKIAAEAAVNYVQDGMIVGLGTGSTVFFAIKKIGERVRNGLSIRAIPTSKASHELAAAEHIPLIDFSTTTAIDLTIDGADEIDVYFNMVKGGGGALLREKIVASVSKEVITIVDSSKAVACLGKFPLPVEVVPFGWEVVAEKIKNLGARVKLRQKDHAPVITDNHNFLLDCGFGHIANPFELEQLLNQIPGVVVNGLFINLATRMIIGKGTTVEERIRG